MTVTLTLQELQEQVQQPEVKKAILPIQTVLAYYKTFKLVATKNINLQPGCAKCDKGYIKTAQEGKFGYVTNLCECYIEVEYINKIKDNLAKSNLSSEIIATYDIEKYREDIIAVSLLYNLLKGVSEKNRMYLYGTPGTGKTYTAIIILLLATIMDKETLYVNVPRLMDDLRPSADDKGKERMQRCIDAEVLVMDDIGQEKPSERVKERLYIIINERYMARKITIFTSNTPLSKIQEKLNHSAIVSRLNHYCIPLDFTGVDKRV